MNKPIWCEIPNNILSKLKYVIDEYDRENKHGTAWIERGHEVNNDPFETSDDVKRNLDNAMWELSQILDLFDPAALETIGDE